VLRNPSDLIRQRKTKRGFLKAVSVGLILSFFFQEISFANPIRADSGWWIVDGRQRLVLPRIPESIATIEDAWRPSTIQNPSSTIFLIQDAHTNPSAQKNIAKTLDLLLKKEKISTVFVEAGFNDVSLLPLKKAPLEKRKITGMSYLQKGELSGAEYLNLTRDQDFTLWGVENEALYWKSLETYREITKQREKFEEYLTKIEITIQTLKPRLFNPSLLFFDQKHEDFLKEKISLTDYFTILARQSRQSNIDINHYPHIQKLEELKDKEQKIDWKLANEEEQKSIPLLTQEELGSLKLASLSRLTSQDHKTEEAFLALLEEKLKNKNEYPELKKYFDYLKESKKLDIRKVLEEQKLLEQQIYRSLTQTQDEERLCKASKSLRNLKSLLNLTLTPDEFHAYEENPSATRTSADPSSGGKDFDLIQMTGFLNKKIMDLRDHYDRAIFLEQGYEGVIKKAQDFYKLTRQRDEVFIQKSLQKMNELNLPKAVLITGGYHSPNLKTLLKDKNISYVCLTPQILHETNLKRYETLLLSQSPSVISSPAIRRDEKSHLLNDKIALLVAASRPETSRLATVRTFVEELGIEQQKEAGARMATEDDLLEVIYNNAVIYDLAAGEELTASAFVSEARLGSHPSVAEVTQLLEKLVERGLLIYAGYNNDPQKYGLPPDDARRPGQGAPVVSPDPSLRAKATAKPDRSALSGDEAPRNRRSFEISRGARLASKEEISAMITEKRKDLENFITAMGGDFSDTFLPVPQFEWGGLGSVPFVFDAGRNRLVFDEEMLSVLSLGEASRIFTDAYEVAWCEDRLIQFSEGEPSRDPDFYSDERFDRRLYQMNYSLYLGGWGNVGLRDPTDKLVLDVIWSGDTEIIGVDESKVTVRFKIALFDKKSWSLSFNGPDAFRAVAQVRVNDEDWIPWHRGGNSHDLANLRVVGQDESGNWILEGDLLRERLRDIAPYGRSEKKVDNVTHIEFSLATQFGQNLKAVFPIHGARLAGYQNAIDDGSGSMVKPFSVRTTSFPEILAGEIAASISWSGWITLWSVGGWIGINIIPAVLEDGYLPESRKSLSWVKSTSRPLTRRSYNWPFLSPLGLAVASYPAFFRDLTTSKLTFSSAMSFQELLGSGKGMVFLVFQDFSRVVEGGVDVALRQAGIAFENFLPRLTSFQEFENNINRDARARKADLTGTDLRVSRNKPFLHNPPSLHQEYTPGISRNQAKPMYSLAAARLAEIAFYKELPMISSEAAEAVHQILIQSNFRKLKPGQASAGLQKIIDKQLEKSGLDSVQARYAAAVAKMLFKSGQPLGLLVQIFNKPVGLLKLSLTRFFAMVFAFHMDELGSEEAAIYINAAAAISPDLARAVQQMSDFPRIPDTSEISAKKSKVLGYIHSNFFAPAGVSWGEQFFQTVDDQDLQVVEINGKYVFVLYGTPLSGRQGLEHFRIHEANVMVLDVLQLRWEVDHIAAAIRSGDFSKAGLLKDSMVFNIPEKAALYRQELDELDKIEQALVKKDFLGVTTAQLPRKLAGTFEHELQHGFNVAFGQSDRNLQNGVEEVSAGLAEIAQGASPFYSLMRLAERALSGFYLPLVEAGASVDYQNENARVLDWLYASIAGPNAPPLFAEGVSDQSARIRVISQQLKAFVPDSVTTQQLIDLAKKIHIEKVGYVPYVTLPNRKVYTPIAELAQREEKAERYAAVRRRAVVPPISKEGLRDLVAQLFENLVPSVTNRIVDDLTRAREKKPLDRHLVLAVLRSNRVNWGNLIQKIGREKADKIINGLIEATLGGVSGARLASEQKQTESWSAVEESGQFAAQSAARLAVKTEKPFARESGSSRKARMDVVTFIARVASEQRLGVGFSGDLAVGEYLLRASIVSQDQLRIEGLEKPLMIRYKEVASVDAKTKRVSISMSDYKMILEEADRGVDGFFEGIPEPVSRTKVIEAFDLNILPKDAFGPSLSYHLKRYLLERKSDPNFVVLFQGDSWKIDQAMAEANALLGSEQKFFFETFEKLADALPDYGKDAKLVSVDAFDGNKVITPKLLNTGEIKPRHFVMRILKKGELMHPAAHRVARLEARLPELGMNALFERYLNAYQTLLGHSIQDTGEFIKVSQGQALPNIGFYALPPLLRVEEILQVLRMAEKMAEQSA